MTALCLGTDDLGDGGLRPPWKKEIDLKPGVPRVEWKDLTCECHEVMGPDAMILDF